MRSCHHGNIIHINTTKQNTRINYTVYNNSWYYNDNTIHSNANCYYDKSLIIPIEQDLHYNDNNTSCNNKKYTNIQSGVRSTQNTAI